MNREQIHQTIHNAYETRQRILNQPHYRGLSSWENQNLSPEEIMKLRKARLDTQVKMLVVNEFLVLIDEVDAK